MELIAALAVGSALIAAPITRWAGVHPVAIAIVLGSLAMGATTVLAAGFMSPAALVAGAAIGFVVAIAAGLGGFLGWLRKKHLEKI